MEQEHERWSSELKKETGDREWVEDGSLNPAIEMQTIVEMEDEGVTEGATSFVIQLTDITQIVARHKDGWSASLLVE